MYYAAQLLDDKELAHSILTRLAIGDKHEIAERALNVLINRKNEAALYEIVRLGRQLQIRKEAIDAINSEEILENLMPGLDKDLLRLACGKVGHIWSEPEKYPHNNAELVNGQLVTLTTVESLCTCTRCGDTKFGP